MFNETAHTLRQRYAADPHRPRYHYLPPTNWMNDPNGLIQWQGQYHLFYQYNPNGAFWGDMHWGHATSTDLIHWSDLPLALAPTPGGPDANGCFSGCALDNNGVPTFIYTGATGITPDRYDIQTQCLATSHDGLLTWEKYAGNPVLSDVPPESGQTADFRDPFVWKEGDTWYMVLASRIKDVGGVIFLYRSPNLTDWEYLHPLLKGRPEQGDFWECPNFFKLGDQWVLILSAHTAQGDVLYFVGDFKDGHFTPIREGILEAGALYAPLTMLDEQGRRLYFGWLRETRSTEAQKAVGWSGVQSIPRLLSLDAENRLLMTPIPELETVRGLHHHTNRLPLTHVVKLNMSGLALDLVATFEDIGSESFCGLSLLCADDDRERVEITYDAAQQRLRVQQITPDGPTVLQQTSHPLAEGETLNLRILLDGSVIEIIANERTSLTTRAYPTDRANRHVQIFGTWASLQALDVWEMPSIWPSA